MSFTPEEQCRRQGPLQLRHAADFPAEEAPGISLFYKDDAGEIFHTYSTYGRGVEVMMGTYYMLDLAPKGRDERDVPYKMEWVRHHDRYEPQAEFTPAHVAHSCCSAQSLSGPRTRHHGKPLALAGGGGASAPFTG